MMSRGKTSSELDSSVSGAVVLVICSLDGSFRQSSPGLKESDVQRKDVIKWFPTGTSASAAGEDGPLGC